MQYAKTFKAAIHIQQLCIIMAQTSIIFSIFILAAAFVLQHPN